MTRIDEERIRDRARNGATLLDVTVPGWYRRLDLSRLRVMIPDDCVLGQLFGGRYEDALDRLGLGDDQDVAHGFNLYWCEAPWWEDLFLLGARTRAERVLEAAWAGEIRRRLVEDTELPPCAGSYECSTASAGTLMGG